MTTDPDLYLPVPSGPKHDEPITAEAYARREAAKREAEENIARVLREQKGE